MTPTQVVFNYLKSLTLRERNAFIVSDWRRERYSVLLRVTERFQAFYLMLLYVVAFFIYCYIPEDEILTSSVSLSRAMMVRGEEKLVLLEIVVPTEADSRMKPW